MLENLLKEYKSANNNLKAYFSNKDIPLDDRWSAFNKVPLDMTQISNGIIFDVPSELLGDMIINKGDFLSYSMFLENIGIFKESLNNPDSDFDLNIETKKWLKNIKLDHLYEIVLANNYHFFTNNW